MQIEHSSKEQFPVDTFELGYVTDPAKIRRAGGEVSVQQIFGRRVVTFAVAPLLTAVRTNQPRVVYYSSSAAYPINLQTPDMRVFLAESDISLDTMCQPDYTYGWAKLTGEVLAGYARKQGVDVFVFRPFSGYGTDQDLDYPFPSFIARGLRKDDPFVVWGDGTATRDFIHIRDVVRGVMSVVDHGFQEPVNLCTGVRTSFNELAELVMAEAGYHAPILHDGGMPVGCHHRAGDRTLMSRFYVPEIDLREGVQMALRGIV